MPKEIHNKSKEIISIVFFVISHGIRGINHVINLHVLIFNSSLIREFLCCKIEYNNLIEVSFWCQHQLLSTFLVTQISCAVATPWTISSPWDGNTRCYSPPSIFTLQTLLLIAQFLGWISNPFLLNVFSTSSIGKNSLCCVDHLEYSFSSCDCDLFVVLGKSYFHYS